MKAFLHRHERLLVQILLVVGIAFVFGQCLGFGFVEFDDDMYVTANAHVQQGLTRDSVAWAFTTRYAAFWHPLTWLSLMLDAQLFGLNAMGFHLTNLLLHAVSSLLLFHLLSRMTGAVWRSAVVAALFAVHPLHVESVAWVAERKDTLSTVFWFLTTWAYFRYVQRRGFAWYLLTLVLLGLGLMAKPMLVTLPCVFLLLDYWPLRRALPDGDSQGASAGSQPLSVAALIGEKLPFLVLAALSSVAAYAAQKAGGSVTTLADNPLLVRLANSVVGYGTYLGKMLWPVRLGCFYPYSHRVAVWPLAVSSVWLAAVSAVAVLTWRRRRYLAVGWLWYVGTLVPVIGLVRVGSHSTADRFTYIPLIGVFIMIAWGVPDLLRRVVSTDRRRRELARVLPAASVGVLLVLAVLARRQVATWQDTRTLFEHALEVADGSPMIHNNLGAILFRQGEIRAAVDHYNEALRLNPEHAGANNNAGVLLVDQGDLATAERCYRRALASDAGYVDAHSNLGSLLFRLGRIDEARRHFAEATALRPEDAKGHLNLGSALYTLGRVEAAIAAYQEALRLDPDHAMTLYNLGIAFATLGRYDDAIAHHARALRLRLDDAGIFDAMVFAARRLPDATAAERLCRRELLVRPNWLPAVRNLAWVLATRPVATESDRLEAVRQAQRAVQLGGGEDASVLDTLAAAYAAAGRFAEAAATVQRAAAATPGTRYAYMDPAIRERAVLYERGEAFVERVPTAAAAPDVGPAGVQGAQGTPTEREPSGGDE